MRRMRIGTLAIAAALAATLGACGGGATDGVDIPSLESLEAGFIGTWEIESATSTDGDITEADIQALNDLGMNVTVDLGDDGTMLIDVFGDQTTGTWEIKDEGTLTLSIEDEPLDAPVEDGTLTPGPYPIWGSYAAFSVDAPIPLTAEKIDVSLCEDWPEEDETASL